MGARFWRLRPETKKDTVVCLTGCAVVLFFVEAGNFDYDQKKKIQSSVGGKLAVFLLWREIFITTGKKKIHYDRKKKRFSRLWQEISIFFVVAGNFDYDLKKKKIQSSVGGKLAVLLLWREIFIMTGKKRYITTGKKRYSRLSDGCAVLAITTGKKKDTVLCLADCAVVLVFGSGRKLAFFL